MRRPMRQTMRRGLTPLLAALAILTLAAGCTSAPRSGQSTSCQTPYPIGYQVAPFHDGRSMAIWYPSGDAQATFNYARDTSTTLAPNGRPLSGCGVFPLVIFSHGLTGCGTQSLFFTETLAREGYVVAAPDHADALCRVDGSSGSLSATDEPSVFNPNTWTDASYADRKDDVELAISMMTSGAWSRVSDPGRIGVVGHSLGGYTALGVVGGWDTWRDGRIKAALLFSPYSLPFSINQTLGGVHAPVMYQGADLDISITPFLEGPTGAYALSNAPKYFVRLRDGNHFTWTDVLCAGEKTVASCIAAKPNAQLINAYGFAFLDTYLKGKDSPLLTGAGSGLLAYIYQQ
jgi:predicted dienelactone hydrolase